MESKNKFYVKLFGLALSLGGILLNPTVLGKFLTTDGQIEQLSFLIIIFVFQGIISAIGLYTFLSPRFIGEHWHVLISFIGGVVLAFIVVEISAQLFLERTAFGWYGYPPGLYEADATKGDRFTPNFHGYFLNPPYDIIPININSRGLRDVEHEYKKPKEVTRILGLGDSVTFGPGVFLKETYLSQLEQLLQQQGTNAEIIKTGVNSYKFDQEYTYYNEEGFRYDSDIVIIGLLHKDIIPVTDKEVADLFERAKKSVKNTSAEEDPQSVISKIRLLCKSCDTLYTLFSSISNNVSGSENNSRNLIEAWENPSNLEHLEKRLTGLDQRLKRKGQRLVIVLFPTTEQFAAGNALKMKFQGRLVEFGKKENIPVLDLLPNLNVPEYYKYYFGSDSVHLNAQGHQLVAKAVKEFLFREKILPLR